MCNEQPTRVVDVYRALHLKYPTIYKHLSVMIVLEWVEPVYSDGEPAFKGMSYREATSKTKDIASMKAALVHFDIRKYHYSITIMGKRMMDAYSQLYKVALECARHSTIPQGVFNKLELYDGTVLKKKEKDELR
jgi:hypothetical protein